MLRRRRPFIKSFVFSIVDYSFYPQLVTVQVVRTKANTRLASSDILSVSCSEAWAQYSRQNQFKSAINFGRRLWHMTKVVYKIYDHTLVDNPNAKVMKNRAIFWTYSTIRPFVLAACLQRGKEGMHARHWGFWHPSSLLRQLSTFQITCRRSLATKNPASLRGRMFTGLKPNFIQFKTYNPLKCRICRSRRFKWRTCWYEWRWRVFGTSL